MTLPRIGVLGGMGPAATILLQQRIMDAVPVQDDDGHFPLLIDMNPQIPSRIDFLLHNKGANPGPVLARMARGLQACHVDAIVMPCNTAHYFSNDIAKAVDVPFLNMVDMTARAIAQVVSENAAIGILASPATERIGLFKTALAQYGLTATYPTNSDAMLACISAIKADGPTGKQVAVVQSAVRTLQDEGVEAIIVGCSEFSLISRDLTPTVPLIDALDVLTNAILQLGKA